MSKKQWGHGFHAGVASAKKKADFPIGHFFLTFKNGFVDHQGQVTSVDGDQYFVQYYSWIMGDPHGGIQSVNKDETADWQWFATHKAWIDAGAKEIEKQHRHLGIWNG